MKNNIQQSPVPEVSINSSYQNAQNTQTIQTKDANSHQIKLQNTTIALAGNLIAFILFWVGFLAIVSKMRVSLQNRKTSTTQATDINLPCSQCQYFSHNHHLRCAVNPSTVLTEAATNCADYCSREC
ncbi:hypothetical protein [Calothrix sp. UHCC 0171]|uniref:hypothetical protein n=1 Tax=Calothrix sp. UHCC 0171 TaxID=3110245 RepID=UPI002B20C5A8|nr:hypothetical protein [Calothrix sp. UHCC 0171]MEA5571093.1 hypothetical protein [Calothrix sp. UHCC 0171]